jgi:hypothetical protein
MSFEFSERLTQLLVEEYSSKAVVIGLLPIMCEVLQSDRCFLHVRNPQTRIYQTLCCRRNPNVPDTSTNGWEPEIKWEREDPMFAAALRTVPSIFVEDVETAAPEVLNVEFERRMFGHCALIHAHICQDGTLSRRPGGGRKSKLNGEQEAHLIPLQCSERPQGQARWTLI